jgi:hypothetical protein
MPVSLPANHPNHSHLLSGNSAYLEKQRRIAERTAQLCADYQATPAQRQVLAIVARYLDEAERGRSALSRTRAANAAMRMLKAIPRKQPKAPRGPATVAEYFNDEAAE